MFFTDSDRVFKFLAMDQVARSFALGKSQRALVIQAVSRNTLLKKITYIFKYTHVD